MIFVGSSQEIPAKSYQMRHRVCTASTELSDPVLQQALAGRGWNAPLDFKKDLGQLFFNLLVI